MMLLLGLLFAAPSILGADIGSVRCPDGTVCKAGTTCELSTSGSKFLCVRIQDLGNQRLFVGPAAMLVQDAPTTTSGGACDNGTWCDDDRCCPTLKRAVCCPNMAQCCPGNSLCCGNATSAQWCCPLQKTRCHPEFGLCFAGASAAAPVFTVMALGALLTLLRTGSLWH